MANTSAFTNIFERYETKYMLTPAQARLLRALMEEHMEPDEFGRSTICNLYYDTPDFLLIRRSLDHPLYKEKVRLRSYGRAGADSTVFLELKKKYKSVVYKRRISMSEAKAMDLTAREAAAPGCEKDCSSQILKEIDYAFIQYPGLAPRMFIAYDREAFYAKDDHDVRITLDQNIRFRTNRLDLKESSEGRLLTAPGQVLAEIKTGPAMPLWLAQFLSEHRIFKVSFSKYGAAYQTVLAETLESRRQTAAAAIPAQALLQEAMSAGIVRGDRRRALARPRAV